MLFQRWQIRTDLIKRASFFGIVVLFIVQLTSIEHLIHAGPCAACIILCDLHSAVTKVLLAKGTGLNMVLVLFGGAGKEGPIRLIYFFKVTQEMHFLQT